MDIAMTIERVSQRVAERRIVSSILTYYSHNTLPVVLDFALSKAVLCCPLVVVDRIFEFYLRPYLD